MKLDKQLFLTKYRENRNFVQVCKEIGISRMAVWKAMKRDSEFKAAVETIKHMIIPREPKPKHAVDSEGYIIPQEPVYNLCPYCGTKHSASIMCVAELRKKNEPIKENLPEPIPEKPKNTIHCEICNRTYTLPPEASGLTCLSCGRHYRKDRGWYGGDPSPKIHLENPHVSGEDFESWKRGDGKYDERQNS